MWFGQGAGGFQQAHQPSLAGDKFSSSPCPTSPPFSFKNRIRACCSKYDLSSQPPPSPFASTMVYDMCPWPGGVWWPFPSFFFRPFLFAHPFACLRTGFLSEGRGGRNTFRIVGRFAIGRANPLFVVTQPSLQVVAEPCDNLPPVVNKHRRLGRSISQILQSDGGPLYAVYRRYSPASLVEACGPRSEKPYPSWPCHNSLSLCLSSL